tara:strand:- start:791 stop:946 length:156 start_codon:yes stop_codon:yes gene_type:complete
MEKLLFKIEYYHNGETEKVEIDTDRGAEWTMEQYQRNRQPLKWELIKQTTL